MSYKLKSFVVFLKVLTCLLISRSYYISRNFILISLNAFCLVSDGSCHPSRPRGSGPSHNCVRMQRRFPRSPFELYRPMLQFRHASSRGEMRRIYSNCCLGHRRECRLHASQVRFSFLLVDISTSFGVNLYANCHSCVTGSSI